MLTTLSGFAIIMLPRQFYVMIVENRSETELRTATWVFPLYLVAINLFVLPIALAGLALVGAETSSDLYVLSLPLLNGHDLLAMAAFIGGLSAATAMVIVASVALSIMISNDLVIPLFVRRLLKAEAPENEDWSNLILNIRRASIFIILFVAFLYYRESTNNARLASIGLMSFAAIAQFAPSFFGGLIWRGANARGAALGMAAGIIVWAYTLLLPSLAAPGTSILLNGPFGIEALRPQALFGTEAEPLNHGVMWSLSINFLFFVLGSLSRASVPLERIQASIFVPRDAGPMPSLKRFRTAITVNDLKDTISRYLGVERTERSFQTFEDKNGRLTGSEQAGMDVIRFSEQLLASAVGSSSARLILSLLFKRSDSASKDAFRLLDDATEALQHNRDLLQIALDQMEQGITVFDQDFRLTCWNRQYRALFDLPDEMGQVGVSLDRILHFLARRGDIAPEAQVAILNRMTTFGSPWQMELKTSGRTIELRSNPMPDGGIVATYADISARVEADLALKRANESLEQRVERRTAELTRVNEELAQAQMLAEEANLGKTRFLAAAGHDILQPLNAARLYCSSLIEKAGRGAAGEAASNIESSLESVETILGAVLDISRLDAGAMKPAETVFRLDGLLRQIGTDFQPMAAEKRLELTIVPSSLTVHTDRNLLRRLIQNLVSNAVKYTRSGRILVGVRRRGELAEIQVFDTGIGIPADKLNSVFREFTRLEAGAREAQGLGLGLSIVDRIARVLRLELQIDSGRGKGTRFSVILPVTEEQEPASAERGSPAASGRPPLLTGMTVLCIDNDARILEGMRLLLEGWGCNVVTHSGSQSIERSDAIRPDIILADYHLDGENGLDLIRKLRGRYGAGNARRAHHGGPLERGARRRRTHRRAGYQQAAEARRAAIDDHAVPPHGPGGSRMMRSAGRLQRIGADPREKDNRLGAAVDAELVQHRRDMRLDGGFGHAEFIGDLLVEQPLGQHAEHPRLLRRQRLQALDEVRDFRVALDAEVDAGRRGDAAGKHSFDRAADFFHARRFRDEARRAEFQRAANGFRIVMGRHDDHGHGRVDAAQRDQAGQAGCSRHRQVEEHEIDVVVLGHQRLGALEIAGLQDCRHVAQPGQRLLQRAAEQRMVVRDHELVA